IVIYAGHATHMHSYLVAREHVSLGYAMFAMLLLAVVRIGLRLARPPASSPDAGLPPQAPILPATATALQLGVTALLLCVPSLAALDIARSGTPSGASAVIPVPHAGAGWHGPVAASGLWIPDFPGAPAVSRAAYESDTGLRVETYWAATPPSSRTPS